jgi:hypothetical protein
MPRVSHIAVAPIPPSVATSNRRISQTSPMARLWIKTWAWY